MSHEASTMPYDSEERFHEAVASFEEAYDAGLNPDPAEWLARYPDAAERLRHYFADREQFERQAEPLLPPEAPALPPTVKGYRILEPLGRGGMGMVYRAVQEGPDRVVALKVIRPDKLEGLLSEGRREAIQRFKTEARAAAQLGHEGIVEVFEVGEVDDRPFYSMRYVEGASLADLLKKGPLEPRRAAAYLEQVARAVHEAHRHGILHRDLKPDNVLVDSVTDRPFVADFGLAKLVQEGQEGTRTGTVLGTPPYMSPEHAQDSAHVTVASDVYSLGATLYALLTGRPPFPEKEMPEVKLRRVIEEEPVPPRRVRPELPRDLETITLKCLEKAPGKRYESAWALAEDLRRFQAGEPIAARPVSALGRGWRWAKRRPAVATLATVSAAACALLLASLLLSNGKIAAALKEVQAEQQRTERALQRETSALRERTQALAAVQEEKQQTQRALGRERRTSYAHRVALAHRDWLANDVARAERLLQECPADLRHWEWHYLKRLCHSELLAFRGHAAEVTAVAFSPDGGRVASASWKEVNVWDATTAKVTLTLPGIRGWTKLAFSPDGKRLATAEFQTVKVWDATTGKELLSIRAHDYLVSGVAFSPDGERLASCSGTPVGGGRRGGGEVKVWDAATGKEVYRLSELPHWANGVAFSPDGKYLAAGTGDLAVVAPSRPGEVRVWDAATGREIRTLLGHSFWVTAVAFSPDSKRLASASADRSVRVWDVQTGRAVHTLRGHSHWVRGVAFSPNGKQLASAGDDQVVKVWELATGQEALALRGHTHPIRGLAFSPDGKRLASAAGESVKAGEVRIWDVTADPTARTLWGHSGAITSVAFRPAPLPAGPVRRWHLASVSQGMSSTRPGEAKIRDVATGKELLRLPARLFGFSAVTFSPDGEAVVTAGDEGVKWWDHKGELLKLLRVQVHPMYGMALSHDGKRVAAVGAAGLTVWDAATGKVLHRFRPHTINGYGVSFSPDGKHLATSSWGGYLSRNVNGAQKIEELPAEVKVWDVENGKEVAKFSGGGLGVAYSPDGKYLASGGQAGAVAVWDAVTGKELFVLRGHAGAVRAVTFSADSKRLASAGTDHTVRVWDVLCGQEVFTLRGLGEPVASVAFSPDGRYLASGGGRPGEPGQVTLWDAGDRQ